MSELKSDALDFFEVSLSEWGKANGLGGITRIKDISPTTRVLQFDSFALTVHASAFFLKNFEVKPNTTTQGETK